jgi:hypothetical protein
MTEKDFMTDEQAERILAEDAAIKAGKATVNELADAEEAGEQLSIGELLERIGDTAAAELFTPERKEQVRNAYETLRNSVRDFLTAPELESLRADLVALEKRMKEIGPFLEMVKEAYDEEAFFWHESLWLLSGAIDIYVYDNRLEDATEEQTKAHREHFLAFFDAYLQEWQTAKALHEELSDEDLIEVTWKGMQEKGHIKGRIAEEAAEAIKEMLAETAELEKAYGGYATLLHRPGLDGLTRINRKRMDIRKNQATGQKTIVVGGLTIEQDYDNVISLLPQQQRQLAAKERTKHLDALFLKLANRLPSVDAMKWLDTCRIILTAQNGHRATSMNTLVKQPLEAIMELWGIPVTKPSLDKFRRTISEVQEAFYSFSFAFEENIGQGKKEPVHLRILQKRGEVKNNILYARFTEEITAYFCQGGYLMEYPLPLMKADGRNPNIYTAGRYLASRHSNIINQQNGKADIISVEALLAALPGIPAYEEVAASRQFKQRIMRPFEAALKGLADMGFFTWNYCNAKKAPLTKAQKDNFNYETFAECYIQYSFLDTKDYGPLIAAREEKKAASKAKQEARKNKAQGAAE